MLRNILILAVCLLNSTAFADNYIKIKFDNMNNGGHKPQLIGPTSINCNGNNKDIYSLVEVRQSVNRNQLDLDINGPYPKVMGEHCKLSDNKTEMYFTINHLAVGFTHNGQYHICTINQKIGLSSYRIYTTIFTNALKGDIGNKRIKCGYDNRYEYEIHPGDYYSNLDSGDITIYPAVIKLTAN